MTATTADVGKRFHVVTLPGDLDTDSLVEVFRPDGTTSLGGPSNDNNFHEDWFSDPIPIAGDYYVKIENSPFVSAFDPNASHYDLLVTVE